MSDEQTERSTRTWVLVDKASIDKDKEGLLRFSRMEWPEGARHCSLRRRA
jgi:hypothetical protein